MKGAVIVCVLALVFVAQAGKVPEKDSPEPKTHEEDSPEPKTTKKDSPEPKTAKKDSAEPEASQRDLVAVPRNLMEWTPRALVNPEELGAHFEGDIILPPGGLGTGRSGRLPLSYRWPNGTVPFEIVDGEFTEEEVDILFVAMEEYYNRTNGCIKFRERKNEPDFVAFMSGTQECSSMVGRQGGKQALRLSPRCFDRYGTILHEMLHALGFFHEQSRTDRDNHVTVKWENVDQSHVGNFKKYSSAEVSPFGIAYDFGSIMHYSEYAFSMNGEKTLVPMDPNATTGQRIKFSAKDLQKLMNMYKCGKQN